MIMINLGQEPVASFDSRRSSMKFPPHLLSPILPKENLILGALTLCLDFVNISLMLLTFSGGGRD